MKLKIILFLFVLSLSVNSVFSIDLTGFKNCRSSKAIYIYIEQSKLNLKYLENTNNTDNKKSYKFIDNSSLLYNIVNNRQLQIKLDFDIKNQDNFTLYVSDMLGNIVFQKSIDKKASNQLICFDLSNLKHGFYTFAVYGTNVIKTGSFILY